MTVPPEESRSAAEFPPVTPDELLGALPEMRDLDVPALVHAEDPARISVVVGDPAEYGSYLASRPPNAEAEAVSGVARMARATGARIHVLHVSSGEAVA